MKRRKGSRLAGYVLLGASMLGLLAFLVTCGGTFVSGGKDGRPGSVGREVECIESDFPFGPAEQGDVEIHCEIG